MQICDRDWMNGLWSAYSLNKMANINFSLVVLSSPPISQRVKSIYRKLFPGVVFADESIDDSDVTNFLKDKSETLLGLWKTGNYFTLPKVVHTAIIAKTDRVITLDPDVLFFEEPSELLHEYETHPFDLGILNSLRSNPPHSDGSFCINPKCAMTISGLQLPLNFGTGLGVICPSLFSWPDFEQILSKCEIIEGYEFMLDQTLIGISAARNGFRRLPSERYAIEPVKEFKGTIARHYYSKTRDLMYVEGMPKLVQQLNSRVT